MNPLVVIVAAVCLLLVIGWLLSLSAAARRQLFARVLLVAVVLGLLLALFSGRLHPLFAVAGGALLVLQRLLAAKQLYDGIRSSRAPGGGANSEVRTRFVDMSLDHDSAQMDGTVREGRFSGRRVSQLSVDELLELLAQCRASDAQSAAVLEAYLDRVHGDEWRERAASGANEQDSAQAGSQMSEAEARDILGVSDGASHDEIVAAHRKLMQKLHPDRGGSTYLAAKINMAKELLLK